MKQFPDIFHPWGSEAIQSCCSAHFIIADKQIASVWPQTLSVFRMKLDSVAAGLGGEASGILTDAGNFDL